MLQITPYFSLRRIAVPAGLFQALIVIVTMFGCSEKSPSGPGSVIEIRLLLTPPSGENRDSAEYYVDEVIKATVEAPNVKPIDTITFGYLLDPQQPIDPSDVEARLDSGTVITSIRPRNPFSVCFRKPCEVLLVGIARKGDRNDIDTVRLKIVEKEDAHSAPTISLQPVRYYAAYTLPCTCKVIARDAESWQELTLSILSPDRNIQLFGDTLCIWEPDSGDTAETREVAIAATDNGNKPKADTAVVHIAILQNGEVPASPHNLRVVSRTADVAAMVWQADTLADSYKIYRSLSGAEDTWEEFDAAAASYADSTPIVYFYRVAAVNYFGASAPGAMIIGRDALHYAHIVQFRDSSSTCSGDATEHTAVLQVSPVAQQDITVHVTVANATRTSADFSLADTRPIIQKGTTAANVKVFLPESKSWRMSLSLEITIDSVSSGYAAGITRHYIVIAHDDTFFTVVYDGNGADGGTVPSDSGRYEQGTWIVIPGNAGGLLKAGYTFAGWNSKPDGSGAAFTSGTSIEMPDGDLTLYAQWTLIPVEWHTVRFNSQGGSAVTAQTVEHGGYATEPSPTRDGYLFAGWSTDVAGVNIWRFPTDSVISDMILYAQWSSTETVMDVDGNVYSTVKIGNQVWMAENLKTTRLNNGEAIPLINDFDEWSNLSSAGYCWYDNDSTYKDIYGALYNWQAVNTGGLAPMGWHFPTDAEWDTLQDYLMKNGYNYNERVSTAVNAVAKSLAADKQWKASTVVGAPGNDLSTNNRTGFKALPGGYRDIDGNFGMATEQGIWWAWTPKSSNVIYRHIYFNNYGLIEDDTNGKFGFSIRCIRD